MSLSEHQLQTYLGTPSTASADDTTRRTPSAMDYMAAVATDKRLRGRIDLAVAIRLAHYSNWTDRPAEGKRALEGARPGTLRLANDIGTDERAVRKSLKLLVELGWAEEVSKGGLRGQQRRASEYRVTFPEGFHPYDSDKGDLQTRGKGDLQTRGKGGLQTRTPEQVPMQEPQQSCASDESEPREEKVKDCRNLTKTYEAFETWAKATLDGKGGDADMDLLEALAEEHGEDVSGWAVNYFSFTESKARALLEHPRGSRYGAAKLAGTLLATANASGCAEVINLPGRAV